MNSSHFTDDSLSLIFQDQQLILTGLQDYTKPSLIIPRTFPTNPTLSKDFSLADGDVYEKSVFGVLGLIALAGSEYLILV